MKIVAIEAIPFAVPYRKPLRFASGEVHTAEHVLVRVHAEDGVVGTAEAPPRPYTYGETQASIRTVIDTVFAPELVGLSVFDRENRPRDRRRRRPGQARALPHRFLNRTTTGEYAR